MKKRTPIPPKLENRLLIESCYRCCICPEHNQNVKIHHINGDPSNNRYDNLIVICQKCHSDVHSTSTLHKNIKKRDQLIFKKQWIEICNDYVKFLKFHSSNFGFFTISMFLGFIKFMKNCQKVHFLNLPFML